AKFLEEIGNDRSLENQVREPVDRKNENCHVENDERIDAEANDLARQLSPLLVIIGEHAKAIRQAPALLTGLQQRDVETGKPLSRMVQRIAKRAARFELLNQPGNGHA